MKRLWKGKETKALVFGMFAIVFFIILCITVRENSRKRDINAHLILAQKYLDELNYEQAIAEYKAALALEPKSQEIRDTLLNVYLNYAQSYVEVSEYAMAENILQQGYQELQMEIIRSRISEIIIERKKKEAEQRHLEEENGIEVSDGVEMASEKTSESREENNMITSKDAETESETFEDMPQNENAMEIMEQEQPEQEQMDSNYFSDDELCEMARKYFASLSESGYIPAYIAIDSEEENMVLIHLYDVVEDHTATCDWYQVDRNTGLGTDIWGNIIDLTPFSGND